MEIKTTTREALERIEDMRLNEQIELVRVDEWGVSAVLSGNAAAIYVEKKKDEDGCFVAGELEEGGSITDEGAYKKAQKAIQREILIGETAGETVIVDGELLVRVLRGMLLATPVPISEKDGSPCGINPVAISVGKQKFQKGEEETREVTFLKISTGSQEDGIYAAIAPVELPEGYSPVSWQPRTAAQIAQEATAKKIQNMLAGDPEKLQEVAVLLGIA